MPDDSKLPTPREILHIHDEIELQYDLDHTGSRVPVPRLEVEELLDDVAEFDRVPMRAAYLLRKLITDHIFQDGNKRTAWVATVDYLDRHDLELGPREIEVERVLKRIRRYDVDEIAEWLENGRLDRSRLNP